MFQYSGPSPFLVLLCVFQVLGLPSETPKASTELKQEKKSSDAQEFPEETDVPQASPFVGSVQVPIPEDIDDCKESGYCGHGECHVIKDQIECTCSPGWVDDLEGSKCVHEGKSKLTAFLVSFFLGGLGVDWFYLSSGSAGYIVAGIFKIITVGGLGIWWLVDWCRILSGHWSQDGAGYEIFSITRLS